MKHRAETNGYTLIEILVVIFIISIVTSVALLSIRQNENKQMETFANELTQAMQLAEEQAMLQPMVMGLSLNDNSFQFSSYLKDEKNTNWIPLDDSALGKHRIPRNIQLGVEVASQKNDADKEKKNIPQIIISTNGDITPFVIYVGKKGQKPRYAIKGDADGSITNKALT